MATMLSLPYKGYRIVCTAMPAPGGAWRGVAEVLKVADGFMRDHGLCQVGGAINAEERRALELATKLAKEWVDDR